MGILNITPDSFSDGGEVQTLETALRKMKKLEYEGADIIDIGACSTAPMNEIVSLDVEMQRLSILPQIIKNATVPVSVDTFRPEVARFALECGASIINDESGAFSQDIAESVKLYGAGWIFMHTGGKTSADFAFYGNGVVDDVLCFFERMKNSALEYGIGEESLCYDCGIGFGKTRAEDVELLGSCNILSRYSPLLVGTSRKRVIGEITGRAEPTQRVAGSVAAAAICAAEGVGVLRVHDVKETVDAVKTAVAIKRGCI